MTFLERAEFMIRRQFSAHEIAVVLQSIHDQALATRPRVDQLESLIAGHMEAMRPLLDEWTNLKKESKP